MRETFWVVWVDLVCPKGVPGSPYGFGFPFITPNTAPIFGGMFYTPTTSYPSNPWREPELWMQI
jgi:hypothetical protein